jgi:hypothetical protein
MITDFEPVQEDVDKLPDNELSLYEEYSRRELPRIFRGAIENIVNEGTSQLEEQLRSQLTSIIRECQDQMFSNYRQQNPSTNVLREPVLPSEPDNTATDSDDLARFYQRPPSPRNNIVELTISSTNKPEVAHEQSSSADSGYASRISTILSAEDSTAAEYSTKHSVCTAATEPTLLPSTFSFPPNTEVDKFFSHEDEYGLFNGSSSTWMEDDMTAVDHPDFVTWDATWMPVQDQDTDTTSSL